MAEVKLCLRNKFGFCKHNRNCSLKHNDTTCDNKTCDVRNCEKRHPKPCWWYTNYRRCKFLYCAYSHSSEQKQNDFDATIMELQKKILEKDYEIKAHELKIENIELKLKENNFYLETRVKHLEQFVLKLQETLEKQEAKKYGTRWDPAEKGWSTLDPLVKRSSLELKCEKCDYVGRNSARLKTHIEVKHMHTCPNCDGYKLYKSEEELSEHTAMVHENLDEALTEEQFDNLNEDDLHILRFGGAGDTPRTRDVDKKYTLRQRQLKLK